MLDLVTIGERVAQTRKSAGLTQTQLARGAQIGRSTLDALENGRLGELGFAKVARLLKSLGLDLQLREASTSRPTLEDLLAEEAEQPLDGVALERSST
jgi:transcriptional regulator with XRE-family HTH domain